MTRKESAILTAYTGILCGPFSVFHAYAEKLLKRPVFTHELANKDICEKIKELAKDDFLSIVNNLTEDLWR